MCIRDRNGAVEHGSGNAIGVDSQNARVVKGCLLYTSTERMLVQLVQNDEGRVIGAVVRDGASGNDVESGKPVAIHATKGVVLATGGFGRDLEFRLAQDPRLDETVDCTNQEGATAESLKAAVRAGAMAVHTDWIQLLPFMSPDEQGYGVAAFYTDGQDVYKRQAQRCTVA